MSEQRTHLDVERVTLTSNRTFGDVLDGIYAGISRPDLTEQASAWAAASSHEDFVRLVADAAGPAGLMRFLQIDLGAALRRDPTAPRRRMVRVIAGNPITMRRMTRYVPQAGLSAPITILVWETDEAVCVAYDTMASALARYGNEAALAVARELDESVLALLRVAADVQQPSPPGARRTSGSAR